MKPDLVYDVGLHHGDDTAYYLHCGYRVVAIEANPVLAEKCRTRFAAEIKAGRLDILNVGIGPSTGRFTFYSHRVKDEWSSFIRNPRWASADYDSIPIRCVPFSEILQEFGTPYYLKVDIEGADPLVIQALNSEDLPDYVSFEAGPATVWTLARLAVLGYDAFKCVDQTTHNAPDLSYSNEDRLRRWQEQWLALKWDTTRRLKLDQTPLAALYRSMKRPPVPPPARSPAPSEGGTLPWVFAEGSSGPFGEAAPGDWQSLEQVLYNWLHRVFGFQNRGTLKADPWYDIHAKRGAERTQDRIAKNFIAEPQQGNNAIPEHALRNVMPE